MKQCKPLLLLMSVLLLSGCWDRMEVEERSTVLGLAVDIAEGEKEDPINHPDEIDIPTSGIGMIEVTAQLAVPGQIPLGPSQGGSQSGPQDSVWVVKAVGHTLAEAVNNLQQQLSSTIFLGHLKIFIISDEVATRGIDEIIDFMKRNPEVRRDAWLLVNGERADETLKVAPKLERIPALYLSNMLDNSIKMGKLPKIRVGMFYIALENEGQDGYLPYLTVKSKENIQISGVGYFRQNKLVGHTQPYQIAFLNGLIGHNPGGSTAVVKLSDEQTVQFQSTKRKSDYKVSLVAGKPHFEISVDVKGNITGKNDNRIDLNNTATISNIEEIAEKAFQKEMEKLIEETQKKESDILGLGEYVRSRMRSYWDQEVKTKEKWREIYKDLSVDVKVKVKIEGVGLKAK
ncbi:Ger(x)C family spore germination protein [Lysinibacillus fusiformis]|nr:Ger(x)C family spore germination protein [Lysinibacillus fusiformis]